MKHPATIRRPSEGRRVGIVGDVYRFLATGDDTDGKYATFEAIVPPGSGPPPHIHSREEESFLVLDGVITFQLGEERIVADEGTFLNMPIGSLHCFKNDTDKPARMLISVAPAGLEKMFLEIGQPLDDDAISAPPPSQMEIEKLLQAAPRYGVESRCHIILELRFHDLNGSPPEHFAMSFGLVTFDRSYAPVAISSAR